MVNKAKVNGIVEAADAYDRADIAAIGFRRGPVFQNAHKRLGELYGVIETATYEERFLAGASSLVAQEFMRSHNLF